MNIAIGKRTFLLGVLSLSAVILLAANILAPQGVTASTVIYDKETYQMQTGHVANGGEAVYITDNRTGIMGVFVYDPNRKTVVAVATKPVMNAFGGGLNAGPARGRTGRP